MSFAVRLSTDLVSVEAGATMPLAIEVVNRAEESDRFELEVEGLDPEWTAVPVPTFVVGAGETSSEKVFFRPTRTPESLAGNYPFVVKVRSLNSGEQRTAQGVLQIQAYHHMSAEISPKKGMVAAFRRRNRFTLTLMNLGNAEHTLHLYGSDPEEALAFDFESDQVTISPGQQRDVEMVVSPVAKNAFASRLYGFSVSARAVDGSSVAGVAHAQLEQRALFTPGTLIFWGILILAAFLWWQGRPVPPSLALGVSQDEITLGQTTTIWWQMAHADRVHIEANGTPVYDGIEREGHFDFVPKKGGTIDVVGFAETKDKRTELQHASITVTVPPAAPMPKILSFTASSKRVRTGETVLFTYKLSESVVRATLSPVDEDLNLNDDKKEIPVTWEGPKTFTLIAENRDHKAVKKDLTIEGYQESEVKIISFSVEPKEISYPGGLVTVSWQLTNAVHAEIQPGINPGSNEVDPAKGKFDMYVEKNTTFTLTAKDNNNLPLTATARVTVTGQPPVPPPGTTTAGPDPVPPTGAMH